MLLFPPAYAPMARAPMVTVRAAQVPAATTLYGEPDPMPREFRGVWVATVDNIDWPSARNLSTDRQKAELIRILDVARAMNLNAIILQVRTSADALYPSKIEPWSEYLTGQQGRPPNPQWDPLEFAVREAHARGLELHCWFNPYRARHPAQKGPLAKNHIAVTNPGMVKSYGKYLWMDPGEKRVQTRSLDVMLDVVRRYDIDGVHIDDYFYPYQEKSAAGRIIPFPDEPSYQRFRKAGGRLTKEDWRRQNVDDFIRNAHDGIHRVKPWVKFGISPFGIYRPGYPKGIVAGVDQYADLYADARKWLREGWCDYWTPQLYWAISSKGQPYNALLEYWKSENLEGRHLWPGNFTSRTDPSSNNWRAKEIVDQISQTRQRGAGGNVHFSMKAFLRDWNGVRAAVALGPYREPSAVPESPWLGDLAPPMPTAERLSRIDARSIEVTASDDPDRRYTATAVGTRLGEEIIWSPWRLESSRTRRLKATETEVAVAFATVGRTGLWSPTLVLPIPVAP